MKILLTIILLLISCCATNGQATDPPYWLVSSRLVRIPIDELSEYLKADSSITPAAGDSLFLPSTSDLLEIDRNLVRSLTSFSKQTHPDRPFFAENIREWIVETSHCYGGQFFGFTDTNGHRVIVCTYQFVSNLSEFQNNTEIAWAGDRPLKNEYAGSVFQFRYNLNTKQAYSFKINDSKKHQFGTIKLETLGYPELPKRPFDLNREKDFSIQLGRGSGWHGIELIKINNKGTVHLHRLNGEHAEFDLTVEELDAIVDSINTEKLTELDRKYINENVNDGTQWLLWIRQNGKHTRTYFSNQFPKQILNFAKTVDAQLRTGQRKLSFQTVKDPQGHAKQIWEIIDR